MDTSSLYKPHASPVFLMAVIVLHRVRPADSISFQTLMQSATQVSSQTLNLHVLLYDNTPDPACTIDLPERVRIHQAARNVGLAEAYNCALDLSQAEGCSWLLTLDQDTSLPINTLQRLATLAMQFAIDPDVAAIVPELIEKNIVQSPLYVQRWRTRRMTMGFCGFRESEITVMNSCVLWRVAHLLEIGRVDRSFWLDYLDYSMSHKTFRSGKKFYVCGDLRVEHQLSLANWKDRLSPERLQNILAAESAFTDLYKAPIDRLLLTLKFVALFWKRRLKKEDPRFLQVIRSEMKRRLLKSRKVRLADWRSSVELQYKEE